MALDSSSVELGAGRPLGWFLHGSTDAGVLVRCGLIAVARLCGSVARVSLRLRLELG